MYCTRATGSTRGGAHLDNKFISIVMKEKCSKMKLCPFDKGPSAARFLGRGGEPAAAADAAAADVAGAGPVGRVAGRRRRRVDVHFRGRHCRHGHSRSSPGGTGLRSRLHHVLRQSQFFVAFLLLLLLLLLPFPHSFLTHHWIKWHVMFARHRLSIKLATRLSTSHALN